MYSLDRAKSCCFTGHRPGKLPGRALPNSYETVAIANKLDDLIKSACGNGYEFFISGMAFGFDMLAAEAVLRNPNAKLVCALPLLNQSLFWNSNEKKRYSDILNRAAIIIYPKEEDVKNGYMNRNKYMVNNSSFVIACFNESNKQIRSGTAATVRYAKSQNVPVINIWDCWKNKV